MKKRMNLSGKLTDNFQLNYDVFPGVPIVEICDKERVLIENHYGIIRYGCSDICVKVRYGCVCVSGNQLKLNFMSKSTLIITGKIHGVVLQGSEKSC